MTESVSSLVDLIRSNDGIAEKKTLERIVQHQFGLIKDRSVYYCKYFAIRFCFTSSGIFSNTVIALSTLQKYDELPFLVCLVAPSTNTLYLANSTFLRKVSHSSQKLRVDNIRGSVNGSDILTLYNGIANEPRNFEELFLTHLEFGFSENLPRLVEATNNISAYGTKFDVHAENQKVIFDAPERAMRFVRSIEYMKLKEDLDSRLEKVKDQILVAAFIENNKIRGSIIEYLIAGEDDVLRERLIDALVSGKEIPRFRSSNDLGDYSREYDQYRTATDVKTKILAIKKSAPKAYNIDKILEFLSSDRSVFMFYFVGIEPGDIVNQALISMFQVDLLESTQVQDHWAGRNSRGVTQFRGTTIENLIFSPNNKINKRASVRFLRELVDL